MEKIRYSLDEICIFLTMIAIIVIVAIVGYLIYMCVYTNIINKRIKRGEVVKKRKVLEPRDAVMCISSMALMVMLIMYLNESIGRRHDYDDYNDDYKREVSRNAFVMADASNPEEYVVEQMVDRFYGGDNELDFSYLSMYSVDENPGYTKEVIEGDLCTFTLFKRKADPNSFHPDFICFIDYKGENKDGWMCECLSFMDKNTNDRLPGSAMKGDSVCDRLLFLGNMDKGSEAVIDIYILNDESYELFSEDNGHNFLKVKDYATSSDRLVISFDD